ncbi:zinc-ribbon domain-containing protein [Agathobaculum sp.]|nr:zinc-ribbon domain-containing protein [Agathobaculum sp.]
MCRKKKFQDVFTEPAEQWHPERNGDLTPDQVSLFSHRKVWWLCERGI